MRQTPRMQILSVAIEARTQLTNHHHHHDHWSIAATRTIANIGPIITLIILKKQLLWHWAASESPAFQDSVAFEEHAG